MSDSRFVWTEWMGADPARAVDFYRHVLGWSVAESQMAGFSYQMASVGEYGVAGLFKTPPEAHGAPTCWTGYVQVADVDAAVSRLEAAGGHAMRAPWDVPNVGRLAIVADPQGAGFALFRPNPGAPSPTPPPTGTPGLVGWRELHAGDAKIAFDFYARQFGWREDRQHDMGPMGVYRIFEVGGQEGGMVTNKAGPGPHWLYYFNVEAADAANARVNAKGGKAVNGPHEVPGGLFVTQCVDPEGAMFGLVAPRR